MDLNLFFLILGCILWIIGAPFACLACYLLCTYKKEEFVRIRGDRFKPILIGLTFSFSHIYVPFVLIYNYTMSQNSSNYQKKYRTKMNDYFLFIFVLFTFNIGVISMVRRLHITAKLKLAS